LKMININVILVIIIIIILLLSLALITPASGSVIPYASSITFQWSSVAYSLTTCANALTEFYYVFNIYNSAKAVVVTENVSH